MSPFECVLSCSHIGYRASLACSSLLIGHFFFQSLSLWFYAAERVLVRRAIQGTTLHGGPVQDAATMCRCAVKRHFDSLRQIPVESGFRLSGPPRRRQSLYPVRISHTSTAEMASRILSTDSTPSIFITFGPDPPFWRPS